MALTEVSGLMKYKDNSGNTYIMLPVTTKDNVDGLDGVHVRVIGTTTAGSGSAYTATVEGIDALEAGTSFVMIPHVVSTATAPTLNVNNLGATNIRRRVSGNSTSFTTAGGAKSWLTAGEPILMTYDGMFWIADFVKPAADDLYGVVPISAGGTGVTDIDAVAPATMGLRNMSLVSTETTPTTNNQICWTYE